MGLNHMVCMHCRGFMFVIISLTWFVVSRDSIEIEPFILCIYTIVDVM